MTVSRVISANGRSCLEHNGKPRLFYGVQIRLDNAEEIGLDEQEIETYFRMSAAYSFPIVAVPLRWGEKIEPYLQTGTDSEFVKNTLRYAEKYNLSVQWLWFGSNVCGANFAPSCVPADILENKTEYPRFTVEGRERLDPSAPALIAREKKAICGFMDMLLRLDTGRRTSAVQIENEPDMGYFNDPVFRRKSLILINELGIAVKESTFSVMTRVNTTAPELYMGEDMLLSELLALDGIDAVGVDVYHKDIRYFSNYADYMVKLPGNLPHFSEMGPHVAVIPQIICDTLSRGCGALIYELRTVGDCNYDFGVFRADDKSWIERDGTQPVQYQWTAGEMTEESNTADIGILNGMISVLDSQLAVTPAENMAMVLSGEEKKVGSYSAAFETEESGYNAFGMTVAADDGKLYCFTLAQCGVFRFTDNGTAYRVEIHDYNEWKPLKEINDSFTAERGCVYRVSRC